MKKWDEDRDAEDEANDENDPERPNLEEMERNLMEEYVTKRESYLTFMMEELGPALKDKNVFVIDDIKADVSAEYVFLKIIDRIKDHF
mmetsp:Transcript_17746/g.12685  ORF Transcript_17746/g.12685 Transcript_17746/m.12685 type:complete len:88 (+) Transcript_17746:1750-2013(+)